MGFRIPSKVVLKLCIQIFLKATPLSIQDSYFSVVLPRLRGIFHGCSIFLGQSLHVEFFLGCVALEMAAVACGREAGILLIIFEEWFWWISPGGKNAHIQWNMKTSNTLGRCLSHRYTVHYFGSSTPAGVGDQAWFKIVILKFGTCSFCTIWKLS